MMNRLSPSLFTVLATLFLRVGFISATGELDGGVHAHKCEDFLTDRNLNLPWTYEDCIQFNGQAGPIPVMPEGMRPVRSCSSVDWVSYFQWDVESTARPESGRVRVIKATDDPSSYMDRLVKLQRELQDTGFTDISWDHLVLDTGKVLAARFLVNEEWWDEKKREVARRVLGRARRLFHRQPREWYSEQPEQCLYDKDRLHFAFHRRTRGCIPRCFTFSPRR
eukprot:g13264.t1